MNRISVHVNKGEVTKAKVEIFNETYCLSIKKDVPEYIDIASTELVLFMNWKQLLELYHSIYQEMDKHGVNT